MRSFKGVLVSAAGKKKRRLSSEKRGERGEKEKLEN